MLSMNLRRWLGLNRQLPIRKSSRTGPSRRLGIEQLEDRVTPSTGVTIDAGSLTGPEGTAVSVSSTVEAANGTVSYSWSVFKDGGSTAFATGSADTFSFTPDDNGSYVVKLDITDGDGALSAAPVTIDITNVAPTATLSGPTFGVRSQPLTFTLGANDVSSVDQAADFTYEIDWDGNGTFDETVVGKVGTQVTHAFTTEATNNVIVRATDKDGGVSDTVSQSVTIKAVALIDDPMNPGHMLLAIGGTAKNDFILLNPGFGKNGGIRVTMGGKLQGIFTGAERIEVFCGDGNDFVQIAGSISVDAWLDGGNGNDRLNSAKGNDVLMGGSGRDWLNAGQGNDMLLGGDDNDFLLGQFGNDILIGGAGADTLNGGPGDDLMVGAATSFDNDQDLLIQLRDLWNSGGTTADRVKAVRDGMQLSSNVVDDHVRDLLMGASGTNWYVTDSSLDRILGNVKTSFVNDSDPVGPNGK